MERNTSRNPGIRRSTAATLPARTTNDDLAPRPECDLRNRLLWRYGWTTCLSRCTIVREFLSGYRSKNHPSRLTNLKTDELHALQPEAKYRPEIDGLRTLAVIPVILFHAGFESFGGGFVGVDVFFVISGYLITTIILAELETGKFSIVKFYERRARRILPALFLVMAASIPFAWLWLIPSDLKDFSQSVAAVSVFASNILFWNESGYFETAAELKPLLHTWSLAVEEQFYVLFPLFLMLSWRLGKKPVVALLGLIAVFSLVVAHWGAIHKPSETFFLLPTRGWELAIGALIAFYFGKEQRRVYSPIFGQTLSILGMALILYSVFAFDKSTPFPSLYALIPTIGTALIILFGWPHTFVGGLLASRAFVGIGLISYSAYLWHQPLFAFARHRNLNGPGFLELAILPLAALALAYLSWRFVESPFRHKSAISRSKVFSFAVVGSAAFIAFGAAGHLTHGFQEAKTNAAQRKVLQTALPSPKRTECHTDGVDYRKPKDACQYHVKGSPWAVFGDSHAVELAYALAEELKPDGVGVRHYSFSGCAPSYGRSTSDKPCSDWTKEAAEYIANDASIKNVVVTYRINSHLFGGHEGMYPKQPNHFSDAERLKMWQSYCDVLRYFLSANKRVILVLQAPELPKPIEALALRDRSPQKLEGASTEWWEERNRFVRPRLGDLPKGVSVIDPAAMLCDAKTCYATRDGVALYFDDDHLSLFGAKLVAAEVVKSANGARLGLYK